MKKLSKKIVLFVMIVLGVECVVMNIEMHNAEASSVIVKEWDAESTDVRKEKKESIEEGEPDEIQKAELEVYSRNREINKVFDPIYLSMNLPSETRSDEMIRMWRDKGYIMSEMQEEHSTIIGIGAIYKTSGAVLPESFTLCIGKMKTFAYLKSVNNWVLIDEKNYPAGVYLYKLPWTEHYSKKCENIQEVGDHIEISLTKKEYEGFVLHFWGRLKQIDRTDVLYVACAYDFWIKEPEYQSIFTATIGVDAKDSKGSQKSIKQLFTGRGLSVMPECRTHWGHTIPNEEYDFVRDGVTLNALYEKWWNIS